MMDRSEAQRILREQLTRFCRLTHSALVPLVAANRVESLQVRGPSGAEYQVEIQFFWDGRPGGIVRVVGSIDDSGIRAFYPLTESFLVSNS